MTATFEVARVGHRTDTHLSVDQLARLHDLLCAERETLSEQLAQHGRVLAELAEERADLEGVERELVGLHAARGRDTLEEIEGALIRLADGTYGVCEGCRRPVPFERLEVVPRARSCVACPPPGALAR